MTDLFVLIASVGMGSVFGIHVVIMLISLTRSAGTCISRANQRRPEEPADEEQEQEPADEQDQEPADEQDQDPTDEQPKRLVLKLAEIRAESYLSVLDAWMHFCALAAALYVSRSLVGLPRLTDWAMSAMIAISYLSSGMARLCPSLVRSKSLWLFHSWHMAVYFVFATYTAAYGPYDGVVFAHYEIQILLSRVLLSIAYPAFWINLFLNAAFTVLTIITNAFLDGPRAGLPFTNIVGNELRILMFLSYAIWQAESLQVSRVRSDLQATGLLRAKTTMERLLADMCDAVVELDHRLCIRKGCPKLASLLLRRAGNNALKDREFAGLVLDDQDRARFNDFVARRAVPIAHEDKVDDSRNAATMYLNLRDSNGTAVSVQVFHSCHQEPSAEICHIVGVHEVGQDDIAGGAGDTIGQTHENERPQEDAVPAATVYGRREQSGDESQSMASVSSGGSPFSMVPLIPDDSIPYANVSLIFDGVAFRMIACTVHFQAITGPLFYKARLSCIIKNFVQFRRWSRREIDSCIRGEDPTFFTTIIKQPRHRGYVKFSAEAAIAVVKQKVRAAEMGVRLVGHADAEEYDILVQLGFSTPQPVIRNEQRVTERPAAPADHATEVPETLLDL